MIGAMKVRVALGLMLVTSFGPVAVSHALPAGSSTTPAVRVEYPDNGASFSYNENGMNGAASSALPQTDDPLSFYVYAFPPAPGTNVALVRVSMVNTTSRDIHFPGGVRVPVVLRNGRQALVALVRHPATTLAPGAGLEAETTTPLRGFGQYSVSALTVVRFA